MTTNTQKNTRASAAPARTEGRTAAAEHGGFTTGAQPGNAPINNMGENVAETVEELVLKGSRVLTTLAKRQAHNRLCIIDWVNFTVHEMSFNRTAKHVLIDNDAYVIEASRQLEKILGYGVTSKRDQGMNFYAESWVLGDNFGFVCFGGQSQTMLITLNGTGCSEALPGWEKRLHKFLSSKDVVRGQISRIDLAHDDMEGAYLSVDWAVEKWKERGFNSAKGGRRCNIETVGNWHEPTGQGRTATFGIRASGKFCRFYEKGKQLGVVESLWCRAEVEFKASDRIIPLDILLEPENYFAGAYPCFAEFATVDTPKRLELKQKTAEISVDAACRVTKHQFGKYNRFLRQLFGDKEWLDKVSSDDHKAYPKRLAAVTATIHTCGEFIHNTHVQPNAEDFTFKAPDVRATSRKKHIKAPNYYEGLLS
ncbi:replication initiation factor domain-containing protein [Undibacterium sp. Ji83W]|uniref:replication initiation factor domain-containing protein n=1 Tax=Undibacterium sp. Ji83W TaxID=3413043 RepID=UPI003BF0CB10